MAVTKQLKKLSSKKTVKTKLTTSPTSIKPINAKQTKSQILQVIAEQNELSLKQVKAVFTSANYLLQSHMIKKGSGEFSIPEMAIKVIRKTKPATKERAGRNPITGEAITISAKPKKEVIRIRALKALKETLVT